MKIIPIARRSGGENHEAEVAVSFRNIGFALASLQIVLERVQL